jgi:hypothetical protein
MLVKERLSWRNEFESGVIPSHPLYKEYKENRLSESWRSTRLNEKFFEYVLWLDEMVYESSIVRDNTCSETVSSEVPTELQQSNF